jgi:hypothetical protein
MSRELSVTFATAGANLYAVLRRSNDDYVWNGSALVAWVNGDMANYDVPLTDYSGDVYSADMPSGLPAGNYRAVYYERAGATPAITDLLLKSETFRWNGTVVTTPDPGSAAWYYSDQAGVERLLGTANLAIVSNLENDDEALDTGTIEADGEASDALINLRLCAERLSAPRILADEESFVVTGLALASDHLTAGLLANHRLLYDRVSRSEIDAKEVGSGFTAKGYEILDAVIACLLADDEDAATAGVGEFTFVSVRRSICVSDENSE